MRYAVDEGSGGPVTPIGEKNLSVELERLEEVRRGPEALKAHIEHEFSYLIPTYEESSDGSNNLSEILGAMAALRQSKQMQAADRFLGRLKDQEKMLKGTANAENIEAHRHRNDILNALDYFNLFSTNRLLVDERQRLVEERQSTKATTLRGRLAEFKPSALKERAAHNASLRDLDARIVDYDRSEMERPNVMWLNAMQARIGTVLESIAAKRPDLNVPSLNEVVGALNADQEETRLKAIREREDKRREDVNAVKERLNRSTPPGIPVLMPKDGSERAAEAPSERGNETISIGKIEIHVHMDKLRESVGTGDAAMSQALNGLLDGVADTEEMKRVLREQHPQLMAILRQIIESAKAGKPIESAPSEPEPTGPSIDELVAQALREAEEKHTARYGELEQQMTELQERLAKADANEGERAELVAKAADLERQLAEAQEQLGQMDGKIRAAESFAADAARVRPEAPSGRERLEKLNVRLAEQGEDLQRRMTEWLELRRNQRNAEFSTPYLFLITGLCRTVAERHSASDEVPFTAEGMNIDKVVELGSTVAATFLEALLKSTLAHGPQKEGVSFDGVSGEELAIVARSIAATAYERIARKGEWFIFDHAPLSFNLQTLFTQEYQKVFPDLLSKEKGKQKRNPALQALLEQAKATMKDLPQYEALS